MIKYRVGDVYTQDGEAIIITKIGKDGAVGMRVEDWVRGNPARGLDPDWAIMKITESSIGDAPERINVDGTWSRGRLG